MAMRAWEQPDGPTAEHAFVNQADSDGDVGVGVMGRGTAWLSPDEARAMAIEMMVQAHYGDQQRAKNLAKKA